MKLRAVVFDLFGTIVDDFIASFDPAADAEFPAALRVPYDCFMQHWRQIIDRRTIGEFQTVEASIEHVCNLIGATVTSKQVSKAVEIRLRITRRALRPRPDALTTLQRLRQDGFKIGLLSNCSIEIPIVWPETPLVEFFDAAIFSSRERIKKPAPQIYQLACERLGVVPEACLYVADGENYELTGAAKVGLRPVLIRNPSRNNDKALLREARDWRGTTVAGLSEVLTLTT
jgi:putative hydrolase of the HAD superfamily